MRHARHIARAREGLTSAAARLLVRSDRGVVANREVEIDFTWQTVENGCEKFGGTGMITLDICAAAGAK